MPKATPIVPSQLMGIDLSRRRLSQPLQPVDIVDWAQQHYYIKETSKPIQLLPHQIAVLRYAFQKDGDRFRWKTVIYSTPKKSGKTTVAGAVTRWAAETWTRYGEIYCIGNDLDQAKEKVFQAAKVSIELSPGYDHKKELLADRWQVAAESMTCLTSGSKIKAVACDYKGEAGDNPSLTVWTELWGYINKDALRFWAEMAPSPAVPNSMRYIETYAGFEGESELLWGLYNSAVNEGRQLTAAELGDVGCFAEATKPEDKVPCYVNEPAGIFAYWDSGENSHRMPWQQGPEAKKYYTSEAATQTPNQYNRLHRNLWTSAESSFVPIEWWDALVNPLPLRAGEKTPLVMALDAAVSGDCFGLVLISRDPLQKDGIAVRAVRKWTPPKGGSIDYAGPEQAVRELCKAYNVIEVTYDPYQLHDLATRLGKEGVAWFNAFNQGEGRMKADKGLYDLILQRRIRHDGNADLREHISNANAKQSRDEDTKLRIVKKADTRHIDLCVCLSMAAWECLRLNI